MTTVVADITVSLDRDPPGADPARRRDPLFAGGAPRGLTPVAVRSVVAATHITHAGG
ncbi:MAG TPA: hypothetical protein VIL48_06010 [Acidimicrobiales bacterium]